MVKQSKKIEFSSVNLGVLVGEFVDKQKNITFKAKGDSMLPVIKDGDTVVVAPYIDNSPEIGDIVAYIDSNTRKLVVHRLIQLSETRFIAKGDSCLYSDVTQYRENILGYIRKINQGVGFQNYLLVAGIKKIVAFLSLIRCTVFLGILLKRLRGVQPIANIK